MPGTSFYGVAHFGGGEIQRWGGGDDPQGLNPMQFVLPKCEIFFITKTWFYFENKNIFVHSDA